MLTAGPQPNRAAAAAAAGQDVHPCTSSLFFHAILPPFFPRRPGKSRPGSACAAADAENTRADHHLPGNFPCISSHADLEDPNLAALVPLLTRDEVVRKVTQVYCLERLAARDLTTAKALLHAMVGLSWLAVVPR